MFKGGATDSVVSFNGIFERYALRISYLGDTSSYPSSNSCQRTVRFVTDQIPWGHRLLGITRCGSLVNRRLIFLLALSRGSSALTYLRSAQKR